MSRGVQLRDALFVQILQGPVNKILPLQSFAALAFLSRVGEGYSFMRLASLTRAD
jgi:hypothetical protein